MIYNNPIIVSDYSDPDVIRYNDNYYMIASSFNHLPGVPVLKSVNLVNWKIIGYVIKSLPSKFDKVRHGEGAWAPSLRFHNGKFYAFIPFPDEGIYVSECTDIEKGDWSPLWPVLEGKGYEDPCPIWLGDKCYCVIGFVKSRIGFNSVLGVFELTPDCKRRLTDYKIVFDGHNTEPTIEGPKFYYQNDYIYILAPAGSVKTGWQTCLRSKNIYGPYEEKIVMTQGDTKTNGPHQGALIDLPDGKWAFIHFQDKECYGRIIHLEPVEWINDWPVIGLVRDKALAGTPVESYEYPVDKASCYSIQDSDNFYGNELSLMWQIPSNHKDFYRINNGLELFCNYDEDSVKSLNLSPELVLTKINHFSFTVSVKMHLNLKNEGDEAGFTVMGREYSYISVKLTDGKKHLLLSRGRFNEEDQIILDSIISEDDIRLSMYFTYPGLYQFGVNGKKIKQKFEAKPGRWIGAKYGLFARGGLHRNNGSAVFTNFKVVNKDGK